MSRNRSPKTEDFPLTPEQEVIFINAVSSTWGAIASDCLQAMKDDGRRALIKRADAIEITLDADYILMYGRIKDETVLKFAKSYDHYEQKKRLAAKAITASSYVP